MATIARAQLTANNQIIGLEEKIQIVCMILHFCGTAVTRK
jgi:hypothetical protein